jgi:hypothetical protein
MVQAFFGLLVLLLLIERLSAARAQARRSQETLSQEAARLAPSAVPRAGRYQGPSRAVYWRWSAFAGLAPLAPYLALLALRTRCPTADAPISYGRVLGLCLFVQVLLLGYTWSTVRSVARSVVWDEWGATVTWHTGPPIRFAWRELRSIEAQSVYLGLRQYGALVVRPKSGRWFAILTGTGAVVGTGTEKHDGQCLAAVLKTHVPVRRP